MAPLSLQSDRVYCIGDRVTCHVAGDIADKHAIERFIILLLL